MIDENPETIKKLFEETFSHKNLDTERRNIDKEFVELKIQALTQELAHRDITIKQLLALMQDLEYYMKEMLERNPSFTPEPSEAMGRYSLLRQGYEEMLQHLHRGRL